MTASAAFGQQRIQAWQPVVKPFFVILSLALLSAVTLALGVMQILVSNSAIECKVRYHGPDPNATEPVANAQLTIEFKNGDCKGRSSGKLKAPVYLYYMIDGFYQNHRRYIMSRSVDQLHGSLVTDKSKVSDCEPMALSADGYRIRTPCGIAAAAVFNDTFVIEGYTMSETVEDLVWSTESQFKNPTDDGSASYKLLDQWLPKDIFPKQMEDPHFMVWMRNAALPKFRKLYGVIKEDVQLPVKIQIANRYPVESFSAKKYIMLTEMTWLGGRNPFTGITFCVIGGLTFCFLLAVTIQNRKNPRVLGDVRFLKWKKQR